MSPNRTCYLSPTGVLHHSSTVLGFHQSPLPATDSDHTDLETDEVGTTLNRPAEELTLAAAADTAVADTEESVAAIAAHLADCAPVSLTGKVCPVE